MNKEEGGLLHSEPDPGFPPSTSLTWNPRFVEFETANDLKTAVEKLDQRDFKGSLVTCTADVRAHSMLDSQEDSRLMSFQIQS